MGKENAVSRPFTRALASALRASEATSGTQIQQRANTKRPASEDKDVTAAPNKKKKREVLEDISNVTFNAPKLEVKNIKQVKKGRGLASRSKLKSACITSETADLQFRTDAKAEAVSVTAGSMSLCKGTNDTAVNCNFRLPPRPLGRSASIVEKSAVIGSSTAPDIQKFIDIDSDDKDPLLCCLYAPEIYYNLRVSELRRRPVPDYMETIQKDVTQSMRGILVDWLVEVSDEYTLVPDTLYLTVYLIDLFLNGNHVERQRLQLLGITCMLISSKYEEIYAPRIEEFCSITDDTYTKDQVLEMEKQVLAHFSFQIYTPTPKTFLRRFLRAAQASYPQSMCLELEFLASYLTELTLLDYHFLKFLPSVIAASAVFLAKWTLDQSNHPWNPTLEHYTTYKASELKASVHALQDLQLNTKGCPLSAVRMKYKQEKFKFVAVLTSPKLLDTLF